MKNIIRFFAIAAICSGAVACKGFLDENPATSLSEASVYGSESALESNIVGVYRSLCGDAMIAGSMNEFVHDASGLLHWVYSTSRLTDIRWSSALKLAIFSRSQYNYNQFVGFYTLINRANKLLEQLPSSPVDDAYKTELEGECHFLRATAYYYIVRCWGDAPIYLKSPTTQAEANAPRSPFWELYKIVVDEYKLAFDQMRDYNRQMSINSPSGGRCANYAAKAMLSQVYLTIASLLSHPDDNFWDNSDAEYVAQMNAGFAALGINSAADAYTLALDTAQDVIDNGPYELAPTYKQLFRWTLQDSDDPRIKNQDWELKERIFVIPNTVECATSNYTEIRSLPLYFEGTAHTSTAAANSNKGRFRPNRFIFQKWCGAYGGIKGSNATYNSDIYIDGGDNRMKATLCYKSYVDLSTNKKVYLYPDDNKCACTVSSSTEMYYRKYADPRYNANSGYSDFYVMRFAEMYLIVAEAAANLCQSKGDSYWTKAFDAIEVLHARARKNIDGSADNAEPKWNADRFDTEADPILALQDAIFWERMFEMTLEGHEYFDTHRMGANWLSRVIARPIEDFLQERQQKYASNKYDNTVIANSYTTRLYGVNDFKYPSAAELRKSLLFAFPNDEIVYNSSIDESDQNLFWWQ